MIALSLQMIRNCIVLNYFTKTLCATLVKKPSKIFSHKFSENSWGKRIMNDSSNIIEWLPSKIHEVNCDIAGFAVLMLNQPINTKLRDVSVHQWKNALLRIAVDGGALYTHANFKNDDLNPHIISGDLDSVTDEVLQYYTKKGVSVIKTLDQDETDFTKALRIVSDHIAQNKIKNCNGVLAICSSGGRMDHVMGNIDTLFYAQTIVPCPVYLLSENSLSWLLVKGNHKIDIHESLKGKHCGLIPIGSPCTNISTTGLRWNLSNGQLAFGKLISSCNKYDQSCDVVTVETDTMVLWTMEF